MVDYEALVNECVEIAVREKDEQIARLERIANMRTYERNARMQKVFAVLFNYAHIAK